MASIFGALSTAISGLTAQSAAFSSISDNIANSQTTGFKASNTNFADYLTTSNAIVNDSGFVAARPEYDNNVQGTISTSTNALAMAVSGTGFFQVSNATTNAQGDTTLSPNAEYTRDGNFKLNANGYLVNDASEALNGYAVDPATGVADQSKTVPIQINQSSFAPVATSSVTLQANLPATPASATPVASEVSVYDAQGTSHQVSLTWTQTAANTWTVALDAPDAATQALGGAQVTFGPTSGNPVTAGTIGSITTDTGTVTSSSYAAGGTADLNFTVDFGSGPQAIALSLGQYGQASGVTQYSGTTYSLGSLSQNGVPPGAFSSVTVQSTGDVVVNYNNNQSRVVAQVPLTRFADADALQRQNAQAFTADTASGAGVQEAVGTGGVGSLVTGATEGSTVDIATEFTRMIVAQQAYSANAKVVTTADQLLQATLNMKT